MPTISELPALWLAVVLGVGALVVMAAGARLARLADDIADRTGLGEALVGAVLLGAATSLPGTITSATTAWQGLPSLAYSNAIGGIAAQTVFLAVADLFHRRGNLEHGGANVAHLVNGVVLIGLLAVPVAARAGPDITVWGVHPASVVILVGYGYGLHLANVARKYPLWEPTRTDQTQDEDDGEPDTDTPLARQLVAFGGLVVVVGIAGYAVGQAGVGLVRVVGLSESVVGALATAIATSTPELVTTIAAVRRGALNLAIGGILGGNAFDMIFASVADAAYREGSIYHAIGPSEMWLTAIATLLAAVTVLGLVRRQREGFAGIGFESTLVFAIYAVGIAGITLGGSRGEASGEAPEAGEVQSLQAPAAR